MENVRDILVHEKKKLGSYFDLLSGMMSKRPTEFVQIKTQTQFELFLKENRFSTSTCDRIKSLWAFLKNNFFPEMVEPPAREQGLPTKIKENEPAKRREMLDIIVGLFE